MNEVCNRYEIGVGRQQVLADDDLFERVRIVRGGFYDVVIFEAVHQVGRLDEDVLDAVRDSAVHRLFEVIDDFAVSVGNVVDDDLGGKASSDAPFGERFDQSLFDRADRGDSGVVEAGAEGYDEQFVLADLVLVEGVIQRSVAGEQVFVCALDALREVLNNKIANGFQFAQSLHDAFHFETFLFEYGFPGIFFVAGHVVIGVVAADDHQRFEDNSLIAVFLSSRHDVVQGRSRFDGAHEAVLQTHLVKGALHGSIDAVGSGFGAMTHENDRGLAVVIGFGLFINCACDCYEIGVGR